MVNKRVVSRCNFNYDRDKKSTRARASKVKFEFDVDTESRRKQILPVPRYKWKPSEKHPIFIWKKHVRPEDIISKRKDSNNRQKCKEKPTQLQN